MNRFTTTLEDEAQDIADFVIEYGSNLYSPDKRGVIKDFIEKHMRFGTILVVKRNGKIVGVCRWNFDSFETAHVLDLIIRPEFRRRGVLKSMLVMAITQYPMLKRLKFERKKYGYRETECLIQDFIGGIRNGRFHKN